MTRLESLTTKSLALNAIPFTVEASLEEAFESFKSNNSNWVSFTVESEIFKLIESKVLEESECKIGDSISQEVAR